MKRRRIAVIVGTRPEAIKLAPVIRELARSRRLQPVVVSTSQHKEMTLPILRDFGVHVDADLDVMRPRQNLWGLSSRLVRTIGDFLSRHRVDAVLVQGDTSSAFFGGLCAFYHKIPVGHVEAGLRSGDVYSPFPEEMNRSLLGRIATWHFAPTTLAAAKLRREGVARARIHVTGNTVVDALRWMIRRVNDAPLQRLVGHLPRSRRLVLVTCHRRESLGAPMVEVARAIATLARENPSLTVLFPIHPNPAVREVMMPVLKPCGNVHVCEPLGYADFLACLKRAWLVLSDSGGVQEEATALGKPVLVLRDVTERMEGVRAGSLRLTGANRNRILREARRLLRSESAWKAMARASKVFGDGHAAKRIVTVLERAL